MSRLGCSTLDSAAKEIETGRMIVEPAGPAAIPVIASPGTLPPFWDRNAVFIANLLGLFFGNEEETRLLSEEVGEVDSYGGRLIPIIDLLFAGPGKNLLVLERE
ncbi:MAG: hypothetical protein KDM63_18910, partial [Verrucomicrobiae bacterium]|nr:hypothetical protein [Verrucomicrobiae bacterium]